MQSIQAIIVPLARGNNALQHALNFAVAGDLYLLALCSKRSNAHSAARAMSVAGVRGMAIDITSHYAHQLVTAYATQAFPAALYGREEADLAIKRNVGLLYGRLAGFDKVLFLDDDIVDLTLSHRREAESVLHDYAVAGSVIDGFPDNSVVRHAQRLSGVEPGVSVGGGMLAINVSKVTSFFPNIYNEDWLFMQGSSQVYSLKHSPAQQAYDPFQKKRAISEEFGDVIAEGLLGASKYHELDWQQILLQRKELILEVSAALQCQTSEAAMRARAALEQSLSRLESIRPDMCKNYVELWLKDNRKWQDNWQRLPVSLTTEKVLEYLGLIGIESVPMSQGQLSQALPVLAI